MPTKSTRLNPGPIARLLLCAAALFAGSCDNSSDDRKIGRGAPNVFVIVIDAASAHYFGCYGDTQGTSPVIDAFAREAVLFENAYSQTATTVSSTASLLTGTRATTHLMTGKTVLPKELRTAAEMLSEIGCRCYGIIGNPWAGAGFTGLDRGYESSVQVYAQPELAHKRPLEDTSKFVVTMPEDINAAADQILPKFGRSGGFAYVHYLQPHKPYDPPEKYLREYPCGSMAWDDIHDLWERANRSGKAAKVTVRQLEARYRANIRYLDEAVGEFFARLKKAGLYDDALIILASDHGDAFFKHRAFGHNVHLYDDMVRIPLIVKFPASEGVKPRRVKALVETIDILPTIFEYIGAERPAQFEGDSLLALATGERSSLSGGAEIINCTIQRNRHAIRVNDYKYIYTKSGPHEELYHLGSDPDEQNNLIATPDGRQRADALHEVLASMVDLDSGEALRRGHAVQSDRDMKKLLDALGYTSSDDISDVEEFLRPTTTAPASQPADVATSQPTSAPVDSAASRPASEH